MVRTGALGSSDADKCVSEANAGVGGNDASSPELLVVYCGGGGGMCASVIKSNCEAPPGWADE